MPDISSVGPGPVGPADRPPSAAAHRNDTLPKSAAGPPERPERPGDRVEVSTHARFLDHIRRLPPARFDRVERVRDEIADGRYETDKKLDAAIDRMVDDLGD